jgi:hypothetical protein
MPRHLVLSLRGHVSPSMTVRSAIRIAGGRAWIQVPLQPCLSRSCAPDLCMCVLRRDGQLPVLRFFMGATRQRFLATHDVRANRAQPRGTAGRSLGLSIERGVGLCQVHSVS